jgi:hypothetical protein
MADPKDSANQTRLDELLEENGWTRDTLLFRSTEAEFLTPTDEPEVFETTGNPDATEAVTDIYGHGHHTMAVHVGLGLAFAEAKEHGWRGAGRKLVGVRLADVIEQGGLLYPVETVITEPVWYATLPTGKVRVRVIEEDPGEG